MHTATQVRAEMFTAAVDGHPVSPSDLLQWSANDRFGIVVNQPYGALGAGLLVLLTGATWIDPTASIILVLVILYGTWGLLRDAMDMALDAAPRNIDVKAVRAYLCKQPGVTEVHDLHIWAMGASSSAMTAHLVMPEMSNNDPFLQKLCKTMERRFNIEHATFQIERQGFDCHPDHH